MPDNKSTLSEELEELVEQVENTNPPGAIEYMEVVEKSEETSKRVENLIRQSEGDANRSVSLSTHS